MNLLDTPNAEAIDANKDYVAELVGEGRKFSDIQALARGKAESDAMIARILQEKRQLEEDLRSKISMQDFLDQMKSGVKPQVEQPQVTPPAQVVQPNTPDIEAMIQRQIEARDAENARQRNLLNVQDKLQRTLGVNYQEQIRQRASQLGLDTQYINDTAAKSPEAFFALMGFNNRPADPVLPRQTVNPPVAADKGRNFAFFNKMRKDSPTEYHSPAIQKEMFERARDPSFFE